MLSPEPPPPSLDRLILQSQKPSRYVGGEWNAVRKDLATVALRWGLAFPDTYEVGMSNVGFRLLYHALNEVPEVACERFFMPWPDLEASLKKHGLPLFSIESRAPLAAFDIVGFTLQFELCYTTVLAMLELGGVPLRSSERRRDDPLILGGGPCAYNPEPVADFFDAFAIGEGEEVIHEIGAVVLDWKGSGRSRRDLLWQLAEVPGVYVPSLFAPSYRADGTLDAIRPLKPGYERVVRRTVPDLDLVPQPVRPILPFMQTVHDRLPLEIQRGCTRGCRFCQVGMITRPTRQRHPAAVKEQARAGLRATGYDEVGFLSLSAGDYGCINGVLEEFLGEFGPEHVSISLPSLRTETMTPRLAEQIMRVRKSGFTVAPEAATERLRRVINKGNAEADLLRAVESIFSAGWDVVKFYFMIGLPTETDEDVRAIVRLCAEALRRGRRVQPRASINVGVSTFCPKPFTPFQWEAMIPQQETQRRQAIIQSELRKLGRGAKDLSIKPHDARQSALEGALALGDRRVGTAVLAARQAGQRLDSWTEHFSLATWQAGFEACKREHGVGAEFFAFRQRGRDEVLPFDHLDAEVSRAWLWKEREAAWTGTATEDCAQPGESCSVCSACDYEVVSTQVYRPGEEGAGAGAGSGAGAGAGAGAGVAKVAVRKPVQTMRVRYAKEGNGVALSHLETMTAMLRALRRADLPIPYSQGFNPKPLVAFGPACPVGIESDAEHLDLDLTIDEAAPIGAEEVAERLRIQLPTGLRLLDVRALPAGAPSLGSAIRALQHSALLPESAPPAEERVAAFWASAEASVVREREGKPPQRINLKETVLALEAEGPRRVRFTVRAGEGGATARPSELLCYLFGEASTQPGLASIRREALLLADGANG